MKKLFFILLIGPLSTLNLTAISVSFTNIEIEQKCYENYVFTFSDLNQGFITGLITNNSYTFGSALLSGDLEINVDYYFEAEDFELVNWPTQLYKYVGTSGMARITFKFSIDNDKIILGKEKEIEFGIQQFGSSNWATETFNISVIPLQSSINNFLSPICSGSRIFTLQNPPDYALFTWTVVRPGTDFTGSSTNANVNFGIHPLSGQGTVIFHVDFSCQLPTVNVSKSFWIGKPGTPITSPSGYPTFEMQLGAMQRINLFKYPGATASTGNWWLSGNSVQIINTYNGSGILVEAVNEGFTNFYVTTSNACGTSAAGGGLIKVTQDGGGGLPIPLSITPNPGDNYIELDYTPEQQITTSSDESEKAIYEVSIYSKTIELIYHTKTSETRQVFNTSGLRNGFYFIHIRKGKNVVQKQFIVKHD